MPPEDFPKRPDAHISEDVSIRVFQECMPEKWIFRDQGSRNDYGIDAEVELVRPDGKLRGDIVKVQLKGKANVDFNSDGIASVGGIKQSTLRYWLSLSRYANVIVSVTDNAEHQTYATPVFWEAVERLDGKDETRSVHFRKESSLKTPVGRAFFAIAALQRPWDTIRAHEELLRTLPRTLYDFLWVNQADAWMTQDNSEVVQRWLRLGRQLLGVHLAESDASLFNFGAWCAESEKTWGDSPMYGTLSKAYLKTFPLVFEEMSRLSDKVRRGSYFFEREAREYLDLVANTPLPNVFTRDGIDRFVEEHEIPEPR